MLSEESARTTKATASAKRICMVAFDIGIFNLVGDGRSTRVRKLLPTRCRLWETRALPHLAAAPNCSTVATGRKEKDTFKQTKLCCVYWFLNVEESLFLAAPVWLKAPVWRGPRTALT